MCENINILEKICRICESTKFLIDITLPDNQHLHRKLCEIQGIENDPTFDEFHTIYKFICSACENNLEVSHEFLIQCTKTRKKLFTNLYPEKCDEECKMEIDDLDIDQEADPLSSPPMPMTPPAHELDPIDIKEEDDEYDEPGGGFMYEEEEHREYIEVVSSVSSQHISEITPPAPPILPPPIPPAKEFKCQNCEKSFNKKMTLDHHKITHSENKLLCVVCEMSFTNRKLLLQHILEVHEKLRKHYCHKCNQVFSTETALQAHIETHKVHKYTCPICNGQFKTLGMAENHIRNHIAKGVNFEETIMKLARKPHVERIPESQRERMCEKCGEMFLSKKCFRRKKSTEITCALCLAQFNSMDELQTHLDVHLKKPFACHICNKGFMFRHKMGYHIERMHKVSRKIKCGYCESYFGRKHELTKHLKLSHMDQADTDNEDSSLEESDATKKDVINVEDEEYVEYLDQDSNSRSEE